MKQIKNHSTFIIGFSLATLCAVVLGVSLIVFNADTPSDKQVIEAAGLVTLTCKHDGRTIFTMVKRPTNVKSIPSTMTLNATLIEKGKRDENVVLVIDAATTARADFRVYDTEDQSQLIFAFNDSHPFIPTMTPVVHKCQVAPLASALKLG